MPTAHTHAKTNSPTATGLDLLPLDGCQLHPKLGKDRPEPVNAQSRLFLASVFQIEEETKKIKDSQTTR